MTPTSERWRPVVGYEGLYEVSDQGRVRSLPRTVVRSDGRVRAFPGQMLRPHVAEGRRTVTLCMDGGQRPRRVYVLVLEAFVGPPPEGMEGCHNDGDSEHDDLTNLRWDTRRGNVQDAVRHGSLANMRKDRCPWGHRLVAPNLVAATAQQGYRGCRACNTARSARRRAVKAGCVFDMQYESDLIYGRIMQLEH